MIPRWKRTKGGSREEKRREARGGDCGGKAFCCVLFLKTEKAVINTMIGRSICSWSANTSAAAWRNAKKSSALAFAISRLLCREAQPSCDHPAASAAYAAAKLRVVVMPSLSTIHKTFSCDNVPPKQTCPSRFLFVHFASFRNTATQITCTSLFTPRLGISWCFPQMLSPRSWQLGPLAAWRPLGCPLSAPHTHTHTVMYHDAFMSSPV